METQALAAVVTDPDATNLVIANMRLLLVRDNATMRPAEEVREKAKALLPAISDGAHYRPIAADDYDSIHAVWNKSLMEDVPTGEEEPAAAKYPLTWSALQMVHYAASGGAEV